jgi:glucosamine--fructose-6-phosphate aminotransferase (isomerizing)
MLEALRRLEYRGYDSAGMATLDAAEEMRIRRAPGKLSALDDLLRADPLDGLSGVGHTRWATHGPPTFENAHPHRAGRVAVVHNGIIENFQELRDELIAAGRTFSSDTDTEAVAHLIDQALSAGRTAEQAMAELMPRLRGAFALVILIEGEADLLLAARRASPLAIGVGEGEAFVGSDAMALAPMTNRLIYLEDGDWAAIRRETISVFDKTGAQVTRPVTISSVTGAVIGKGNFRHFMEKEIHDQPEAVAHTLHAVIDPGTGEAHLPACFDAPEAVSKITIIAAGTSYYAGLTARYWFESLAGIACEVEVASEFRERDVVLPKGGVVIAISQSGESLDTLMAMRRGKAFGQSVLGIVNVPESTIAREADGVLMTRAGPEFGVAATKTFTAQLTALLGLAIALGRARGVLSETRMAELVAALTALPAKIGEAIASLSEYGPISQVLAHAKDVLYLARGLCYPIALEGALKLKEITYVHAEGFAAGEMKHGPIALIDEDVPVIALAPSGRWFEKAASNFAEARARGGRMIVVSDKAGVAALAKPDDMVITLPDVDEVLTPILYTVPVQLMAYLAAVDKGTDADQPRNLAKSVTVE